MPDFTRKQNTAALAFIVAGSVWFVVGVLYGLIGAIHLMAPEFFSNIPFAVFGRARPVHVNTVVYGFVASALIGSALYYVPALLRTRLWSEPLAWFGFLSWEAAVLSGPITFAFGWTQAREYAEYVFFADVLIVAAILTLIVNFVMTVMRRKEPSLYVSVWYAAGALIWTAGAYPIGNVMWHPGAGALPGIMDSIFLWFWGHDLVGLLATPLAVGASFFIIPRIVKGPLYSHVLSLIGFWTLVAIYAHIGGHHILQAPIPNWLKAISVVDSMAMFIPVFTVLYNMLMTARGRGGMLWRDPAGRFLIFANIWYLITCIQGPLQSLPEVQKVTHFTNWVVAHAHIAVLGFAGMSALGATWHILPLVARRKLYSERLAHLQFGLVMAGLTGFFIVLTMAGLIQGQSWHNGTAEYRVLPMLAPYMALRAFFAVFIIAAAFIGLYNVVMTVRRGEPFEPATVVEELR